MTRYALFAAVFVTACLLGMELVYRYQIVDCYLPELDAYTAPADLEPAGAKPTALVLGNSVSVVDGNYVGLLREDLPRYRFVNAAVGGSGSFQMRLIAPRRFAAFQPQLVIYQVAVGTNVFNARHVIQRDRTSPVRYYFWKTTDYLPVIGYINYRLGQMDLGWLSRSPAPPHPDAGSEEIFSVAKFTPSARAMIAAAPSGIDDAIFLHGPQAEDARTLIEDIRATLFYCQPPLCRALILLVPHPVQAASTYVPRYEALGATFSAADNLQTTDYPLAKMLANELRASPNISIINPLDEFQARERVGEAMYLVNDFHPTAAGQHVLAQNVANAIGEVRVTANAPP